MSNIHPIHIGPQNKHVLDNISRAYKAALALVDKGYTVLDIKIGQRNPVIEIQPCRKCQRLGGGLRMIDNTGPQRQHIISTHFQGAQVEWRETA